jgi:hypothetical protein
MKINYTHPAFTDDETGEEKVFQLESKREVCPRCQGIGRHSREDIDDSYLVDIMIADGDEEGLEGYYNGNYDVICTVCNGQNVVDAPVFPEWMQKKLNEWYRWEAEYRRECDAERRMGA